MALLDGRLQSLHQSVKATWASVKQWHDPGSSCRQSIKPPPNRKPKSSLSQARSSFRHGKASPWHPHAFRVHFGHHPFSRRPLTMCAYRRFPIALFFVCLAGGAGLPDVQGPTSFGKTAAGENVDIFTLTNDKGMSAKVMTLGAVLVDLKVPDKTGKAESVVLGYDNVKAYEKGSFYGATVGRVANRIAGAKFTLDGKEFKL